MMATMVIDDGERKLILMALRWTQWTLRLQTVENKAAWYSAKLHLEDIEALIPRFEEESA